MRRLSNNGYDHIAILDLLRDKYEIFTSDASACCVPSPGSGSHSAWMDYMLECWIVPKDRESYKNIWMLPISLTDWKNGVPIPLTIRSQTQTGVSG